jgi:DNA-binding FadR family transcriptional regulator
MATSQADHVQIAEALFGGDSALAIRYVQEHLEYGKQALVA